MQTESEPNVRRKKSFRARGSRGGARRKRDGRNNQNNQGDFNSNNQHYNNGYAPPHSNHHNHYQPSHHQQQYYANQAKMNANTQHQQQHAPINTYASMAYTHDVQVQQSQSWGSSMDASDKHNNDNLNPNQENIIQHHDSILPHLPPSIVAQTKIEAVNENEKQMNFAILPMQKIDQNLNKSIGVGLEASMLSNDNFLKKSPSLVSVTDLENLNQNQYSTSLAIPDVNLDNRSGSVYAKINSNNKNNNVPANSTYWHGNGRQDHGQGQGLLSTTNNNYPKPNQHSMNVGLDFFSTMHPIFDANANSHATTNENKHANMHIYMDTNANLNMNPSASASASVSASSLSLYHMSSSGGSFFETSPRSFLMGKKESKTSSLFM